MTPEEKSRVVRACAAIGRITFDLITGNREDLAAAGTEIVSLVTDMIPVNDMKPFLTASARKFVDLNNDIAEELKLSGIEP